MKTIVMDTANSFLIVALYENDTCVSYIEEEGNRKQSEYAILHLQSLLEKQGWELETIDQMIITIGPGSYTGVRVALTIAKTLASVTNIKIKTVSSLLAHAGIKKVVSVLDARSNKVFVGVYNNGQAVVEDQILPVADFADWYQQYNEYDIVGDGHLVGFDKVTPSLHQTIYEVSKSISYCENVDALVPHYLKGVEAKKICN